MVKFPKVLGFLNLKSGTDAVTEANLQSAEDKIAALEQEKNTAEQRAQTAESSLTTACDELTKTKASLDSEKGKVATLEEWKKNQKAVDAREEDDSNTLDEEQPEALASWEKAAASAIEIAKKRVGKK
jgi:predicted  nucleic acid-binding Zn-ribbon protein